MKVALLYICTGRYIMFWEKFFESANTYFLKDCHVEYFVFTNGKIRTTNDMVTVVECEHLNWPFSTLMRFHLFCKIEQELRNFDYVFFMNANIMFLSNISQEEILPLHHDLTALLHPGLYFKSKDFFTYERCPESLAFMSQNEGINYYSGALNGGKSDAYIQMAKVLSSNIDKDLENGIIAIWHDESHLNKYLWKYKEKVKGLSPAYGYPEEQNLPFERKILILDKAKMGGHDYFRQINL